MKARTLFSVRLEPTATRLRRRRLHLLTALLPLVVLSAGCYDGPWSGREARRPPRLTLSATEMDFGRVLQGDRVKHVFTIGNDGEMDLSLVRWRSASDCRVTIDGPSDVPAGGERALAVVFDTDRVSGPQRRTVTLYTNDPERRSTLLTLVADVALDAAVRPPRLYLGTVRRGERTADALRILTAEGVRIESVEAAGTRLEAELKPAGLRTAGDADRRAEAAPAGEFRDGARVAVVVSARAPLGRFSEDVHVRTSSARHPLITVPITGAVGPDLTASPAEFAFGEIAADSMPVRETLVQNHARRPVEILAADSTASFATVTVSTVRKGFRYRVGVTLDEPSSRGPFDEFVRLRTDHPAEPVFEVPLRGVFKDVSPGSGGDP